MSSAHESLKRPLSPSVMDEGNDRPTKKQAVEDNAVRPTCSVQDSVDGGKGKEREKDEDVGKDVLDALEAELGCACCAGLLWKPMLLNPCHHAFCGSCLSQWVKNGGVACPGCRSPPTSMHPARILQALIDLLLRYRPEAQRSVKEREQADELWLPGEPIDLPPSRARPHSPPPLPLNLARPCPHCLAQNGFGWTCPRPIPDPAVVPRDMAWDLQTQGLPPGHGFCAGCDELHALESPSTIRCSFCRNVYCGYSVPNTCIAPRIGGAQMPRALDTADKLLESDELYSAFSSNSVEVDYLIDHLRSKAGGLNAVLREIVDHVRSQPSGFAALEFLCDGPPPTGDGDGGHSDVSSDADEQHQPVVQRDVQAVDHTDSVHASNGAEAASQAPAVDPDRLEPQPVSTAADDAGPGEGSLTPTAVTSNSAQTVARSSAETQEMLDPLVATHDQNVSVFSESQPRADVPSLPSAPAQLSDPSDMDVDSPEPVRVPTPPVEQQENALNVAERALPADASAPTNLTNGSSVATVPAGVPASRPRPPPSRICRDCAESVFHWGIYDWWVRARLALGEALPPEARNRKDCADGKFCHKQDEIAHAREFNHVCDPQPPPAPDAQTRAAADLDRLPLDAPSKLSASNVESLAEPPVAEGEIGPAVPHDDRFVSETQSSEQIVESMITVSHVPSQPADGSRFSSALLNNYLMEDVAMDGDGDSEAEAERQISPFSQMDMNDPMDAMPYIARPGNELLISPMRQTV